MSVFSVRRYITPSIQGLVWILLGFILLVYMPLTAEVTFPYQFWVKQGVLFFLAVAAYYLNAGVWVPRLLFQRRTGWFILVNIATSLAVIASIVALEAWLELPRLVHQAFHPGASAASVSVIPPLKVLIATWVTILLLLLISTSIAIVQKWQKDEQIKQRLEQEKVRSELSFLKAQINPHFFFNTLNNIHALTLLDIAAARQALHTLSRMMRYVLYETQKDTTLLSKEIIFLQDYIELMKLRLNDNVEVTFKPPTPLKDVTIAPMLFLPLVENAFKHGVSGTRPSCIHISLMQQGAKLQMEVRNTTFSEDRRTLDGSSGIGLVNTRRRLDLLYPDAHTLSIDESKSEYQVQLVLDVS